MPCNVCGKQMVWSIIEARYVCANIANHNFTPGFR